jgi:hypothetical protein
MYYTRFILMIFLLFLSAGLLMNVVLNLMRHTIRIISIENWSLAISVTLVGTGITGIALLVLVVKESIRGKP